MSTVTTRNLTILLTDIKGFTDKTSRKSRSEIIEMLDRHRAVVLPVLEGKGGKLVKTIGDAFLMTFDSPTDAVLAGIGVQDALRAHNEGREGDDRLDVRIAINTGEVNLADNDIFGEPVNITARIEAVAEAGEVFFTEAVYLAMNKKEVPSSEVGLLQLKGIPEKVRVYKVKREEPISNLSAAQKSYDRPGATVFAASPSPALSPATAAKACVLSSCSVSRRALALIIDLCLVGLFVNFIQPRHGWLKVRVNGDELHPAAAGAIEKAAAGGNISIDKNGLHMSDDEGSVTIGKAGIVVKEGAKEVMRVDKNRGVQIKDQEAADELAESYQEARKERKKGGWGWLWPSMWFAYCLVFYKKLGTTPGGKIAKIGLARMDGKPVEKRDRTIRAAFSILSGYCLGIGYLWALFEKDGRGWHDLMAGTRVVNLDP